MSYSAIVLADSPLRYYRLGDASGSATALDSSTSAQNGTVSSTANVAFGLAGAPYGDPNTAANFNGSGYITVPVVGLPTGNAPFTLEGWFKTSTNGATQFIASIGIAGTKTAGFLYVNSSNQLAGDLCGSAISSSAIYTDGRWHYAAFTWDGTTGTLYADGVKVASSSALGPNNITESSAGIGYQAQYGGNKFTGLLDEVAIYGTALSSAQIQNHFAAALPAANGSYASTVLSDSPVRYYALDDLPSSTSAVDSSTSAQNGTVSSTSNVTFWQAGAIVSSPYAMSASLNGSGYISIPQTGLQTANGAFTLEGWFKTSTTGVTQCIVGMGANATQQAGLLYLNTSNQLVGDLGSSAITSTSTYTDGAWHHAVFTWDGTTGTLYADGVQVATSSTLGPNNLSQSIAAAIGYQQSTASNYLTGAVDEVAIYNTALTSARVSAHYTAGVQSAYDKLILSESGLLRYYPLRETSGTTVADLKGGYTGTISGSIYMNQRSILGQDQENAMQFLSGGYISLPTTGLPTGNSSWSLEIWCAPLYSSSQSGYGDSLISMGTAASREAAGLSQNSSGWAVYTWNNDIGPYGSSARGDVYHLVATYDGTTIRLYQNGVLQGSGGATPLSLVQTAANIGVTPNTQLPPRVVLQKAAIYNTALTAAQISNHYAAGTIRVPSAVTQVSVEALAAPAVTPRALTGAYVEAIAGATVTPRVVTGVYIEVLSSNTPGFIGWGVPI